MKQFLFVLAVLAVPAAGIALLFFGGIVNRWLAVAGVPLFGVGLALCGYVLPSTGGGPRDNAPGT